VYFTYGIIYLMVLIHLIYVIMMQYTITYREVCYLINRFGIHFSVFYKPYSWLLPNTTLNIYSSPHCIQIFRMQRKIVRIMMGCKSRTSCMNLFWRLEILPLYQYIFSLMFFVWLKTIMFLFWILSLILKTQDNPIIISA
jgi:hypothetical protein